jgi:Domain of unknown function (DUF1906)
VTLVAREVPDGSKCLDCWGSVTAAVAKTVKSYNYEAIGRYRQNLTKEELAVITGEGLGVWLIGAARAPLKWSPTADLGTIDGTLLAQSAAALGLPPGTHLMTDYETPAPGTTEDAAIAYLNSCSAPIESARYQSIVYEGYGIGIGSVDLYRRLTTKAYCKSASNVEPVAVRGYRLVQTLVNQSIGGGYFDIDIANADALGGRLMCAYAG